MTFRTWLEDLKSARELDRLQHRARRGARRKPSVELSSETRIS